MRAVAIARPGGAEVLEEREVEDLPAPGEGEVLLEVAAAGVNRTDTVQRQGGYTLPPGASPYPGVECSGTILALGANVSPRWAVGDQVSFWSSSTTSFLPWPMVIAAAASCSSDA
jgi:NADPH:quinone reductase-like Zn-dependent oxidoreductase